MTISKIHAVTFTTNPEKTHCGLVVCDGTERPWAWVNMLHYSNEIAPALSKRINVPLCKRCFPGVK